MKQVFKNFGRGSIVLLTRLLMILLLPFAMIADLGERERRNENIPF